MPGLAASSFFDGEVASEWTDWQGSIPRGAARMASCTGIGELDAIFVDGDEPVMNPPGVKGCAELGLCGVGPAIANAVWHATEKRVRDLPITTA